MVVNSLNVLKCIVILETLLAVSCGSVTYLNENVESSSDNRAPQTGEAQQIIYHSTPVRHYAVHGLCGSFQSKANLYKALKSKFCGIRGRFTYTFVMKLCQHRDLLFHWVKELFDIDHNGYISHFEKNLYKNVK